MPVGEATGGNNPAHLAKGHAVFRVPAALPGSEIVAVLIFN